MRYDVQQYTLLTELLESTNDCNFRFLLIRLCIVYFCDLHVFMCCLQHFKSHYLVKKRLCCTFALPHVMCVMLRVIGAAMILGQAYALAF